MNPAIRGAPSMYERVGQRTLIAVLGAMAAVVLLGGVVALIADEAPLPAEGARVSIEGIGLVRHVDGSEAALRDGDIVRSGDQIEVEEGTVVLELAGGGTIEARSGRDGVDDTRLEVGVPAQLLAGDALASGPVGVAVEAAGTLVTIATDGAAARLRRELAVTAATYEGAVEIDSAGQSRTVPALRQLSVASVGRTPPAPVPLVLDVADPWDLRYLGGAIALTRSLDALSSTFTAQGVARTTPGDFAAVLPRLGDETAFGSTLLDPARPAGETLVGAAIAVLGQRGSFAARWQQVFDFRDDGADWGLVAFDHAVAEAPVLGEVERALSRSVERVTDERAIGPPVTGPTVPIGGGTPTTSTPAPSPSSSTVPPTTGTPTTPPPTTAPPIGPVPTLPVDPGEPAPGTGEDLLDGLLEPAGDLLGGLLG